MALKCYQDNDPEQHSRDFSHWSDTLDHTDGIWTLSISINI